MLLGEEFLSVIVFNIVKKLRFFVAKRHSHSSYKKTILILTVLLSVNFGINSQTATDSIKRNSVYIELLGNSLIYSLNYDHLFDLTPQTKLAVGVGVGYLYIHNESGHFVISEFTNNVFLVTPEVNFLIGRSSKHFFETGLSLCNKIETDNFNYKLAPALRIGYRFQPLKGGFLFRIGFTPMYYDNKIYPLGGLSFGYSF